MIPSFEPVSYEAIIKRYHKEDQLFTIETGCHEVITVDETKVKINAKLCILWTAIDVENLDVLGIWISKGHACLESYSFLKHVRFQM
jgi:transposase-like protein